MATSCSLPHIGDIWGWLDGWTFRKCSSVSARSSTAAEIKQACIFEDLQRGFEWLLWVFVVKHIKEKRLSQHRKRIESAFTETKLESGDGQRSIPFFFLDSILCRLLELMLAQSATSPQLFFFTLPSPEASDASFHKDLRVVNLPPLQCSVRKTNLDIHGNSRLSSPRNLASLISEQGSHPASSPPCRPSQVNHRLSRVQMAELRTNF